MWVRLKPGQLVDGRYVIEELIGLGGFAHVYKAKHIHIDRWVALKLLSPQQQELAQRNFEARFLREARTAARVRHSAVVEILDFGFENHSRFPYLVMEFLEGHDLEKELMISGAMTPRRALELIIPCLDALAKMHKRGIIHRDLKPANLFLVDPEGEEERLVLLDFGATALDPSRASLGPGFQLGSTAFPRELTEQHIGTPQYYPPELLTGGRVSPALDVYQMGLVIIEMLAGEPAVQAHEMMACLQAHIDGELQIPTGLRRTSLGHVLLKASSRAPEQRYANALQLVDALMPLLEESGITHDFQREPTPSFRHVGSGVHPAFLFSPSRLLEIEESDQLHGWTGWDESVEVLASEPEVRVQVVMPSLSSGHVEDLPVARLLHLLSIQRRTGKLTLSQRKLSLQLDLLEGAVYVRDEHHLKGVLSSFAWDEGQFVFRSQPGKPAGRKYELRKLLSEGIRSHVSFNAIARLISLHDRHYPAYTIHHTHPSDAPDPIIAQCDGSSPLVSVMSSGVAPVEAILRSLALALVTDALVLCDQPCSVPVGISYRLREIERTEGDNVRDTMVLIREFAPGTQSLMTWLRARHKAFSESEPYALFGLERGCGRDALQQAYLNLVREFHPSRFVGFEGTPVLYVVELIGSVLRGSFQLLLAKEGA